MNKKTHGFTIVELLIVIVIIAILAAITIVAYNGIQNRAKDNKRYSDAKNIMKAIEVYKTMSDSGQPPQHTTSIDMATLRTTLATQDISGIPDDTEYPYRYLGSGQNYLIRIYQHRLSAYCKVSSGTTATWFGGIAEC